MKPCFNSVFTKNARVSISCKWSKMACWDMPRLWEIRPWGMDNRIIGGFSIRAVRSASLGWFKLLPYTTAKLQHLRWYAALLPSRVRWQADRHPPPHCRRPPARLAWARAGGQVGSISGPPGLGNNRAWATVNPHFKSVFIRIAKIGIFDKWLWMSSLLRFNILGWWEAQGIR